MGNALAMSLPGSADRVRAATDFAAAVREHQDLVYGVALRILGDPDLAADVQSTTFLHAYRAWHRYDPSRPLRPWLATIAAREAISAGRAQTRRAAREIDSAAAHEVADRAPSPDDVAVVRDERARIRRAVAALPELYRVPIVLRYFADLSVAEVAAAVGRSTATVGVQLLRGRALLREHLGGEPA